MTALPALPPWRPESLHLMQVAHKDAGGSTGPSCRVTAATEPAPSHPPASPAPRSAAGEGGRPSRPHGRLGQGCAVLPELGVPRSMRLRVHVPLAARLVWGVSGACPSCTAVTRMLSRCCESRCQRGSSDPPRAGGEGPGRAQPAAADSPVWRTVLAGMPPAENQTGNNCSSHLGRWLSPSLVASACARPPPPQAASPGSFSKRLASSSTGAPGVPASEAAGTGRGQDGSAGLEWPGLCPPARQVPSALQRSPPTRVWGC